MGIHTSISPGRSFRSLGAQKVSRRVCPLADRRDAKGQMALFTEDTHFVVYMNAKSDIPTQQFQGRDALARVFDNLNQYETTTHCNDQSTVVLDGAEATGLSYCLAHHLPVHGSEHSLMIASIRYLDRFTKIDGVWYLAQRRLFV